MKAQHTSKTKWLRWLIYLMCIAILLILYLINSSWALHQVLNRLATLFPQELQFDSQKATGNLIDFHLPKLKVTLPIMQIDATSVTLSWNPIKLFENQLNFTHIHAQAIHIHPYKHRPGFKGHFPLTFKLSSLSSETIVVDHVKPTLEAADLNLSYIPDQQVNLNINHVLIYHRILRASGHYFLSSNDPIANLDLNYQNLAKLNIKAKVIDHQTAQLDLKGNYSLKNNDYPIESALQLTWHDLSTKNISIQSPLGPISGPFKINWDQDFYTQLSLKQPRHSPSHFSLHVMGNAQKLHVTVQSHNAAHETHFMVDTTYHQANMMQPAFFTIKHMIIDNPWFSWHFKAPEKLMINTSASSKNPQCLENENIHICTSITHPFPNYAFQLDIHSNRHVIIHLGPYELSSQLNWQTTINKNADTESFFPHILSKLNLHNILISQKSSHLPPIFMKKLHTTLDYQQQILEAKIEAIQSKQNTLVSSARLSFKKSLSNPDLLGSLNLQASMLGWLDNLPMNTQVLNAKGMLNAKANLTGTLDQPQVTGYLKFTNGQMSLINLGLPIKDINLQATSTSANQFVLKGHLKSGQGQLYLNGTTQLSKNWQINSDLKLYGNNIQTIELPNMSLISHIALTLHHKPYHTHIKGKVEIQDGSLNLTHHLVDFSQPDDLILTHHHSIVAMHKQKLAYLVQVDFKKAIPIQANFNLKGQLNGSLTINKLESQDNAKSNGNLNIENGSVSAYGKDFKITKGLLGYKDDPIDNPNLDITALYSQPIGQQQGQLNQLKLGAKVFGTLQKPIIQLFSTPPMSQPNILSYIITGGPLSQASNNNNTPLTTAALQLALMGANKTILGDLQKALGINQISIGTLQPYNMINPGYLAGNLSSNPNQDNTAVFVGKSLGSNLYISYGFGLFTSQQEVRSSLKLNRYFKIITNYSSVGSGGDILYTIDH